VGKVRKKDQKADEWADRLQRKSESSLSVSQFCELEGVSQASYYNWKSRLEKPQDLKSDLVGGGPTTTEDQQPARAKDTEIASGGGMVIRLPNGITIELGNDPVIAELVLQRIMAPR